MYLSGQTFEMTVLFNHKSPSTVSRINAKLYTSVCDIRGMLSQATDTFTDIFVILF